MRIQAAVAEKTRCGCGIVLTDKNAGGECLHKPMGNHCSSILCDPCFKKDTNANPV
jgi:hypothetical protein